MAQPPPTEEQILILQEKQSFRVLAAAGSGKTTTMATYVKQEVESHRLTGSQIMFITFTKFAAKQIKTKLCKIGGRALKVMCGTFHSVMFRLMCSAGIANPPSNSLYSQRFDVFIELFLENLRNCNKPLITQLSNFRLLIVDEFQDLDDEQFEFIKLFKVAVPSIRTVAIGDLAQNIYRFRGTSNEFLNTRFAKEVCPDLRTFQLTTNFRSTPAILKFVNALFAPEIKDGHILPMSAPQGVAQGKKPVYYEFAKNPEKGCGDYETHVADQLYPLLRNAKELKKSVCLIFPKMKCLSYEFIAALLRNKLKQDGFPFDLHKICKEDETCATIEFEYSDELAAEPVQCSTFHSSKGLEWDIVCVINVSDSLYYPHDGEEESEGFFAEKTNLLYVAITRAAKQLYIFANANDGGRHRHIARLWDFMQDTCDIVSWGTEQKEYEYGKNKPIAVTQLIKKFPQHKEIFARAIKCSENIPCIVREGVDISLPRVYEEMKERNRELALGSYIDWKLKQIFCTGESKTIQEIFLELRTSLPKENWFHRNESIDSSEMLLFKISLYFLNTDVEEKRTSLKSYLGAVRWIARYTGKMFAMAKQIVSIWKDTDTLLTTAMKKPTKSIRDEYIISQAHNFYIKGLTGEIDALFAPENSYQGLPIGFEEFVGELIEPGEDTLRNLLKTIGCPTDKILGDLHLESESLILGEADMVIPDELLIEIKCGTSRTSAELRDVGNCKHLLQVLSYVALGRHGALPMNVKKACLVNPMTGAWEIYDLEKWSTEDSAEFMACLEELKTCA